jgi:hypothetical protein
MSHTHTNRIGLAATRFPPGSWAGRSGAPTPRAALDNRPISPEAIVTTSLPYPTPPVQVPEPVHLPEGDGLGERLRGLSPQQLLEAMQFLAWWSPGVFTAVLDYCEAGNWGTDDFDPDPAPDPEDDDDAVTDLAPYCGRCGGDLGIFLRFGLDWRHYSGSGLDDIELYEPGHAPELAWRAPVTAVPAGAATQSARQAA